MTNNRDHRNQSKGYMEALRDITIALNIGGEEQAREWIWNNLARDDARIIENTTDECLPCIDADMKGDERPHTHIYSPQFGD